MRELGRLDQHEDDKDDVGLADIGAEPPGRLRPLHEPFDQRRVALAGDRDQIPAVGGEHQHLPQAEVARHGLGHPLHEEHQTGPGVRRRDGLLADRRDRVEAIHEQRLDQLLLSAEPPVDGADTDPRMTGDLVQADLEPALAEHLRGRRQDPLPVPLGIAPQRPRTEALGMPDRVLRHLKPPGKKWRNFSASCYCELSGERTSRLVKLMSDVNSIDRACRDRRRWADPRRDRPRAAHGRARRHGVNMALPSAQRALSFTTATGSGWSRRTRSRSAACCCSADGSADLIGRKLMFLIGADRLRRASALGGASVNFGMLVTARACQGAFGAMLAPPALSLLTTTFSEPKERGKAFGVYGAIAGAGGAIGLLLGGAADRVPCLALVPVREPDLRGPGRTGGAAPAQRQRSRHEPQAGPPGRAAPSPARVLPGLRVLQRRHAQLAHAVHLRLPDRGRGAPRRSSRPGRPGRVNPLLPPRVVLDRNRGGAYLAMLIAGAGMFGIFLFLTYYLQQTLGVLAGRQRRRLPADDRVRVATRPTCPTIVLLPRIGPKPLVTAGVLLAAGAMPGVAHRDRVTGYAAGVLGPLMLAGLGFGLACDRAVDEHRHLRRGPARRGRRLRHRQHRPADSAARSALRCSTPSSPPRWRHYLTRHRRSVTADRPPGPARDGADRTATPPRSGGRRHLRRRRDRPAASCSAAARCAVTTGRFSKTPGSWRKPRRARFCRPEGAPPNAPVRDIPHPGRSPCGQKNPGQFLPAGH